MQQRATTRPKLYLETTIPGSLAAWSSHDLIRAARQQITREWWDTRRLHFELFVSQVVIQEVSAGDQTAAAERLKLLENIAILQVSDEASILARELLDTMSIDSLVDEIRAVREAYAARFNYDIEAICRDIKEQEQKSGRTCVSLVQKRSVPDQARPAQADIHETTSDATSSSGLRH